MRLMDSVTHAVERARNAQMLRLAIFVMGMANGLEVMAMVAAHATMAGRLTALFSSPACANLAT